MGEMQILDWNKAAASTLEWWDAAGVDVLTGDDPFDWLAAPEPAARAPESRAAERPREAAAPAAPRPSPCRRRWSTSSRGAPARTCRRPHGAAR
ncbi:MAG: hypothetical protein QM688_08975 [Sphingomonas bacterium]